MFLLVVDVLAVTFPYRLQTVSRPPIFAELIDRNAEIGGLSLLHVPVFDITIGGEVIVAVLVLLGMRWISLGVMAALAAYWVATGQSMPWIPYPLQLLTTGVFLVEAAALIASPGPRRGRQLMNWRYAVVLLVAAGAVQLSTFLYNTMSPFWRRLAGPSSGMTLCLAGSIVLAAAVVVLALIWKLSRYLLLLLAAMCYPYAIQLAFVSTGGTTDLLGNPTPAHLTALYLPLVLFAFGVVLAAVTPHPSRLQPS